MLTMLGLLAPPLLASALSALPGLRPRAVAWIGVSAAAASLLASVALCMESANGAGAGGTGPGGADALSGLLALCIAFVTLLASVAAPGFGAGDDPAETRRLRVFMSAFAFTMLAAVTVQNVALMWVAIEATTITSAMVIPLRRTKASVEASWKYILICSVGIALAFTGTVLAYFDFVAIAGDVPNALNWAVLRQEAPALHPFVLQLAFAFLVVGYGTKAGLAPMHTWLPDAHSEAPSPVSAMMSGVLLAVALYAIARWKAVVDAAVPSFAGALLVAFGALSVAIGALSLVLQRHYKRMLAYSSIEHMGLAVIGLALGPLGVFAAWLHVVNHALAKSLSFLLAGRLLHRYGTADIDGVRGVLRVMPWTGGLFAVGILALVGLPPFGLFVSEFLLVRAAVMTRHLWLAGTMLVLLLTAFVALVSHVGPMLYGDAPAEIPIGDADGWTIAALAVPAALLVLLGVVLPTPLSGLIHRSVAVLLP